MSAPLLPVTAVVLSAKPVQKRIPGISVAAHVSTFSDAAGLLDARLRALDAVQTEWFFYLDDDDELPADYLDVLAECMDAEEPLAYTNEIIVLPDGAEYVRRSGPYSRQDHLRDCAFIHHLAVCRTAAAREAAGRIPRGMYGVEPLLFGEVAKAGARWVDRIGYVWRRRASGMSKRCPSVSIGMVRSLAWLARSEA